MSLNALQRQLELADLEHCMKMDSREQFSEYLESLTEENIHQKAYCYDYIQQTLEQEFPETFGLLSEQETLVYELVRLTILCGPVFQKFGYPESGGCPLLREGITGKIAAYLAYRQIIN